MDKTIIEMQGPNCDELFERIRQEKNTQGKPVHQIIEDTGVSKSTLDRFFAGTLKTPGFIPICALCAYYGISVDQFIGLVPSQEDQTAELDRLRLELGHKGELLEEKAQAVDRLLDRSRMLEQGIATRDAQIAQKDAEIKSIRRSYRPLIYGLCGLSILLTVLWGVYVILDFQRPDVGLIRADNVSPVVLLGIAGVVVLLVMLLHITVTRWYRKVK